MSSSQPPAPGQLQRVHAIARPRSGTPGLCSLAAAASIACKQPGTRARLGFTLVDQEEEGAGLGGSSWDSATPELFAGEAASPGLPTAACQAALRPRPGHLAGDRLVLRARVEVVV